MNAHYAYKLLSCTKVQAGVARGACRPAAHVKGV